MTTNYTSSSFPHSVKYFSVLKQNLTTLDQLEHQDLLCRRILQAAEHGSWKIVISLTGSRTRTMKVKIISPCTLKMSEKWE